MNRKLPIALVVSIILFATPTFAHHSFPATYLIDAPMVTIEGKLATFLFKNPHSYLHVLVTDDEGNEQRWAIEWGNVGRLTQDRITRETFKRGDFVIITGNPGRNPADHRVRMQKITRPADGFEWGGDFD